MDTSKIIEQLIFLHLYLLESLSINDRKLKYSMSGINNIKKQYSAITIIIDLFIKHIADIFIHLNKKCKENVTSEYLSDNKQNNIVYNYNICDIFDGRLFYHTLNQLNKNDFEKTLSNLHCLCNNKELFDQLKSSIDKSNLKQTKLGKVFWKLFYF